MKINYKPYLILLLVLVLFNTLGKAQRNVSPSLFFFGIGENYFIGDVGNKHINLNAQKHNIQFGYRYKFPGRKYNFLKYIGIKTYIFCGQLLTTDFLSKDKISLNRNLHFKTNIIEIPVILEFCWKQEKTTSRLVSRWNHFSSNIFIGIGAIYFNPKAKNTGNEWYALQPLGTEGQGIGGNVQKYQRVALSFPMGINFKYKITRRWAIHLELTYHLTTTDYLDDVHGNYFDVNSIRDNYGDIAAELSDKRISTESDFGNINRGNPDNNDKFLSFIFSVYYTPKKKRRRRGMPKHRSSW